MTFSFLLASPFFLSLLFFFFVSYCSFVVSLLSRLLNIYKAFSHLVCITNNNNKRPTDNTSNRKDTTSPSLFGDFLSLLFFLSRVSVFGRSFFIFLVCYFLFSLFLLLFSRFFLPFSPLSYCWLLAGFFVICFFLRL